MFFRVYEADPAAEGWKPGPESARATKEQFILAKYVHLRFVAKQSLTDDTPLREAISVDVSTDQKAVIAEHAVEEIATAEDINDSYDNDDMQKDRDHSKENNNYAETNFNHEAPKEILHGEKLVPVEDIAHDDDRDNTPDCDKADEVLDRRLRQILDK